MKGQTFPWCQDSVAAKVSDFYHHAVVHHTVGGFESPVHGYITGVQVRHTLTDHTEHHTLITLPFIALHT